MYNIFSEINKKMIKVITPKLQAVTVMLATQYCVLASTI